MGDLAVGISEVGTFVQVEYRVEMGESGKHGYHAGAFRSLPSALLGGFHLPACGLFFGVRFDAPSGKDLNRFSGGPVLDREEGFHRLKRLEVLQVVSRNGDRHLLGCRKERFRLGFKFDRIMIFVLRTTGIRLTQQLLNPGILSGIFDLGEVHLSLTYRFGLKKLIKIYILDTFCSFRVDQGVGERKRSARSLRLEDFLKSLGSSDSQGEGSFTLAADRARKLLSERALTDPWQAWLSLLQGFHQAKPQSLSFRVDRQMVEMQAEGVTAELSELARYDRFLLGWLNLEWFGCAVWDPRLSLFQLKWSGSVWRRYRDSANFRSMLRSVLAFSPIPIQLNDSLVNHRALPVARKYQLYHSGSTSQLSFDADTERMAQDEFRITQLSQGDHLAAVAFTSGKSWSQARWVHHGVLIKEERNTLERPGLSLIASVEALGLHTDLSGFQVVHDQNYLDFTNRLKKEVLWML